MSISTIKSDPELNGELSSDVSMYLRKLQNFLSTTSDEELEQCMFPKYPDILTRARDTLTQSLEVLGSLAEHLEENQDTTNVDILVGKNFPGRNAVVGLVADRLRKSDSTQQFLMTDTPAKPNKAIQGMVTESTLPGLWLYKITSARLSPTMVTEEYRLIGQSAYDKLLAPRPVDGPEKAE